MSAAKNRLGNSIKIPLLIVTAVMIIAAVYGYARSTREHLKEQAYYAVGQNVGAIANEIESSIGYATSSIRLTSQSATQSMDSEVIEDVNAILDPLLESTPFNFIEYILADGWNTMNDGGTPFDASDREYYKQGIQGKTGIWINFTPKKSKEVLLNFYTPLYYEGNIVGVFTGTLGGDTNMKPLLTSTFFGEEVRGFLCDSSGYIIASTVDGLATNTAIRTYLTETMGVSDETYGVFAGHVSQDDETAFAFRENAGNAVACISCVEDLGWYVVQIVPAKSLANIMNTTTIQLVLVIGFIILLFVCYFLYADRERREKAKQEIAEHRGVIEVLGREYSSVYLINTETKYVEPFRLAGEINQYYGDALKKGLLWDDGVADYAKRFVKEDYKAEFLRKCSLDNLLAELREDGQIFTYEYINDRDGEQHVYRIIASLLPDSKVKHIVLGFADINEERENELAMQRALQDACRRAEAANGAKSAFLFNMSHDIRTPMNAIIGFTNMLEKCREDENAFRHCVDNIKVSSNYLLNLINNVLDLARIESGKATLDDADLWDAQRFNDNLVTVFSSELEKKNLTLRRTFDITHEHVFVDTTKLEQIFMNILSNAVKYTPAGGDIYMTVTEVPSDKEGYCCYRTVIEDTGVGISQEFLPHIFDEFAREKNSTESGIAGTGLGMGITKKMIDLMEGTISIESELGKGTKVTVCLPHRIAAEPEVLPDAEPQKAASYDASVFAGKRILLAEDNALNVEIAVTILEEAGFTVEHAGDGAACVDMLERREAGYYDLILMDIQMPNMDGYQATEVIRNMAVPEKASIPIIAMTANAFEEDRKAAFAAGMNGHIAKPIDLDKLFAALSKTLSRPDAE